MTIPTAATTSTLSLRERWPLVMANTYGTPGIALVRGEGTQVWDESGKRYLDFLGGIAVNALGHAHPDIVTAVTKQLQTLGHTSNLAATAPAIELAERLANLAGQSAVTFFANSGAEANEAAFKFSRLTGRGRIVAAIQGFHGRTAAALSMTGQPAKREPFLPLIDHIDYVPFGDLDAMTQQVTEEVAMVLLEPIQGEAGVIDAPAGYLPAVQQRCREVQSLFVLDEVQTGVGRTGSWFAHQHEQLEPDGLSLAKGLGGGLPIGAFMVFGDMAAKWQPGMHGSTFGGNPVSAAAALAVLDVIERDQLLDNVRQREQQLRAALANCDGVSHITGRGLLLGLQLHPDVSASEVASRALSAGLIVNAIGTSTLRLAPPLIVTKAQMAQAADILRAALAGAG